MTDYFDLTGKVALVTGGSRGLGYQMVKAFAAHGADIFITSRKPEACEQAAVEVRALGRKAATYACNVANWQELDGLVDAAYAAFGKVDILVNNAAHQATFKDIGEISDKEWELTFKVNIHAMFYLTKAAAPHMKSGSAIVNTASVNSDMPNPILLAYATTNCMNIIRCWVFAAVGSRSPFPK